MRYCYCPKCDQARPKNFRTGSRCETCRDECVLIEVKRSVFGLAMYALDIVAAVMILFYLAYYNFNADFASFVGAIDETLYVVVMFGLILVSFVFAAIDLGKTNQEALRMARERKGKIG